MEFDYEVFVSYASPDREWASRLNDQLVSSSGKLSAFFDRTALHAGDYWEGKIEDALMQSKHLVVLWSPHAKDSSWVSREISAFYMHAKPREHLDRRLIFVNLQGENTAYRSLQQVNKASLQKAYQDKNGAEPSVWEEVTQDVLNGLDPKKHALRIPLVVLTLTGERLNELTPKQLKSIENDYGLSRPQIEGLYGPKRDDWRPLAGTNSIADLLEGMRCEIEKAFTEPKSSVTWHEPEAAFWDDMDCARQFVESEFQRMELSLLLIDPVALGYDHEALKRLNLFHRCFGDHRTVVAVLPPLGLPRLTGLKKTLLNCGAEAFNEYFRPRVPPDRRLFAQCVWNAVDTDDIRRHLLLAFGDHALKPEQLEKSPILRMGGH